MTNILEAAFLGLISGLLPVYLGLLPIPLLKRLSPTIRSLLVNFSLGILLFLFADVTMEAFDLAKTTWQGSLLVVLGLTFGLIMPGLNSLRRNIGEKGDNTFLSSYLISFGIGLHNLGEGLALGAAYGSGQITLTTLLLVGFALHNGTEGLAISGPILENRFGLKEPLIMGFIAGFPTIIGSMIGSIAYSDLFGDLFFSLASGALLFVVLELARRSHSSKTLYLGLILGILVMYFTDLLLSI
ncbi:MAG: ZIP family metal transporter [Candidatus Bathyarchaeota archaeon]|nr:ZIP family metal transporter [Candidatus Bathyarchaeota archaeon]